ncbi:MAG: DsbA family oxidoreductase [Duncaniella sp.]|nr:DsbA family oxidoreductase [Duncaniella sp.]
MIITVWSDFACPFCYIGESRLEKAISDLGMTADVRIDYMSFQLDTDFPRDKTQGAVEHFMEDGGITEEHAVNRIAKIERIARSAGLEFKYVDAKYCNTFDAHRLVKYADATDKTVVEPLVKALFAGFFSKGLILSDRNVLCDIAVSVGLDRKKVLEFLDSDRFADDVHANERVAAFQGVKSVPYVLFDGEFAMAGAVEVDDYKKALLKAKTETAESGHKCGPDGCEL